MIYCGITVDLTIRGMLISGKTLLIPQKRGTFRSRQARTPADERYPESGPALSVRCTLSFARLKFRITHRAMQDTRKRDLTIRLQPEDGCASLKAPPVPPLALHTFKTEAMSRGGTLNASRHQPLAGILAPLGQ